MTPFEVRWERDAIGRVLDRVRRYPFDAVAASSPDEPGGDGWALGCDPAFLRALCAYWCDGYDPDAAMARLNRYPQALHRIDGIDLHAIHVVGEAEGRRPLLLTHGWPGSVVEFLNVAGPLAFPSRHGGRAEDAFDLVIPSLPGYGPSGRPSGLLGARRTASLFDRLMRESFGYRRYRAQGGDWGAGVTAWLGIEHAASLDAIHLNFLLVQPDATPETDEERAYKAARDAADSRLGAYAHLQVTRPRSLAFAMADNPVAQAAWILERFHDWSDLRGRGFDAVFDRETLLDNVMVYVMNDAFASSVRYYAAAPGEAVGRIPAGGRVSVPTGFAAYHDRRSPRPPRSWVERGYDVAYWSEPARGGHFAALEAPALFVDDLRAWGRVGG